MLQRAEDHALVDGYWSRRQEFNFTIVQVGFAAGGQIGYWEDFSRNISPLSWQL